MIQFLAGVSTEYGVLGGLKMMRLLSRPDRWLRAFVARVCAAPARKSRYLEGLRGD